MPTRLEWSEYCNAQIDPHVVESYRTRCATAFRDQRDNLTKLYRAFKPKQIACMGAGFLNDIPINLFLRGGSHVALIDWVPRVSEHGFQRDLIRREGKQYTCLACELGSCPEDVCQKFTRTYSGHGKVCDNFQPVDGPSCQCASYAPGSEPRFVQADVTQGCASEFAQRVPPLGQTCKTASQCFSKAIEICHDCAAIREELPLPTGSMDLVTSSMVVSQFDHEPYGYFSKFLVHRYGDELAQQETTLIPLMQQLRSDLFEMMLDAHIREMYRLVNKESGMVYFSSELFSSMPEPEHDRYYPVQLIPQALEKLRNYFTFDSKIIPLEHALRRTRMDTQFSIIQSYVLRPLPQPLQASTCVDGFM